jgi:hypothetical protein
MDESFIYLATCYDAAQKETERLIKATKPTKAMRTVVGVRRATPEDVARIIGAGGKIEDAAEG